MKVNFLEGELLLDITDGQYELSIDEEYITSITVDELIKKYNIEPLGRKNIKLAVYLKEIQVNIKEKVFCNKCCHYQCLEVVGNFIEHQCHFQKIIVCDYNKPRTTYPMAEDRNKNNDCSDFKLKLWCRFWKIILKNNKDMKTNLFLWLIVATFL